MKMTENFIRKYREFNVIISLIEIFFIDVTLKKCIIQSIL